MKTEQKLYEGINQTHDDDTASIDYLRFRRFILRAANQFQELENRYADLVEAIEALDVALYNKHKLSEGELRAWRRLMDLLGKTEDDE